MGKVSSEAKSEVEDAIELQDEWLDLILEANQDIHLGGGAEDQTRAVSTVHRIYRKTIALFGNCIHPSR
jgi:hypothetical protein